MCIVRFVAEGVGPFERLDLDLSDGRGNPHLGPHVLAGVNGSGKSTALRAIAWSLATSGHRFDFVRWTHLLSAKNSYACTLVKTHEPFICAASSHRRSLAGWVKEQLGGDWQGDANPVQHPLHRPMSREAEFYYARLGRQPPDPNSEDPFFCAAYAPTKALQYLPHPDMGKAQTNPYANALGFETTCDNESLQAWFLNLFSRGAIAARRGEPAEKYDNLLSSFQTALEDIFAEHVTLDVSLDSPVLQPLVKLRGSQLNLSQIPDGIRGVLGWLGDFLNRREMASHDQRRQPVPSVLLIDELDAHLHPRWQRQILPAIQKALPGVQIIVATHSPFIISSCREAKVHVLQVSSGKAQALPPVDAPFGYSVNATLKDIFDVNSQFDLKTERDLDEWDALKRRDTIGKLSPTDKKRLQQLTTELSERSEELKFVVGLPPRLSESVLGVLGEGKNGGKQAKTRRPARQIRHG